MRIYSPDSSSTAACAGKQLDDAKPVLGLAAEGLAAAGLPAVGLPPVGFPPVGFPPVGLPPVGVLVAGLEEPEAVAGLAPVLALVGLDADDDERHEFTGMRFPLPSTPRQQDLVHVTLEEAVPESFTSKQQLGASHGMTDLVH
jgi:hypothetical protein